MTSNRSNGPRELTPRQRAILLFIAAGIAEGRAPSIREIGREFGIGAPNGVVGHLDALEHKGYIQRESITSRGINLPGARLALGFADDAAGWALAEALSPLHEDQR